MLKLLRIFFEVLRGVKLKNDIEIYEKNEISELENFILKLPNENFEIFAHNQIMNYELLTIENLMSFGCANFFQLKIQDVFHGSLTFVININISAE